MNFFQKLSERFGKKAVIGVGFLCVIFVISVAIFAIVMISRIGKTKVIVKYAPFTAEVKFNGKKVKNSDIVYMEPGKYHVDVNLEHFSSISEDIDVSGEEVYAIGELVATDMEGETIAKEHQQDFLAVEQYGGRLAAIEGEKEAEKYPIIQYLPINSNGYSVNYVYDREKDDFKVELVMKNIGVFGSAIYDLYNIENNIKPAEYEIVVRGYKDPFGEFATNVQTDLESFIRAGFGDKIKNYDIYVDKKVEQDGYVGVIMAEKGLNKYVSAAEEEPEIVVYRMIVKKEMNGFSVEAMPYPIISRYNSKNAPIELIDKLNHLFPAGEI